MIKSPVLPKHIAYFRSIERITSGKQNAFYRWLIESINKVGVMAPIPHGLHIVSKKKQRCFSNSARTTIDNSDILYVEGYVYYGGVYIEHAWNRTTEGIYFDVTIRDNSMEYYPVIELTSNEVLDMIEYNDSRFGPFLTKYFYKNIYNG